MEHRSPKGRRRKRLIYWETRIENSWVLVNSWVQKPRSTRMHEDMNWVYFEQNLGICHRPSVSKSIHQWMLFLPSISDNQSLTHYEFITIIMISQRINGWQSLTRVWIIVHISLHKHLTRSSELNIMVCVYVVELWSWLMLCYISNHFLYIRSHYDNFIKV